MSRHVKTTGSTASAVESTTFDVCALRFPTGVVGVFKLVLEDDIARLVVADAGTLHAINEMPADPARSAKRIAIDLLFNAAEASARRCNHFDVLMRCEVLQEGLIDVEVFERLAAWVAMRGIIQRAMDGATFSRGSAR